MKNFLITIYEDFRLNSFRSFYTLFAYRVCHVIYKKARLLAIIMDKIFLIGKILLGISNQISYKAKIGRRIRLPHSALGVIISSKAVVWNDVTIYHMVTIGINEKKTCRAAKSNCWRWKLYFGRCESNKL